MVEDNIGSRRKGKKGKRLFKILTEAVFYISNILHSENPLLQRLKKSPWRPFRGVTFTFIGYDAVTNLLEDLCQAGSTSHFDVLFSCSQTPRPDRAGGLKG